MLRYGKPDKICLCMMLLGLGITFPFITRAEGNSAGASVGLSAALKNICMDVWTNTHSCQNTTPHRQNNNNLSMDIESTAAAPATNLDGYPQYDQDNIILRASNIKLRTNISGVGVNVGLENRQPTMNLNLGKWDLTMPLTQSENFYLSTGVRW